MKKLFALSLLLVLTLSCGQQKEKKDSSNSTATEITTYYFIRHAEKDRSEPEERNPYLTQAGLDRAKNWASFFDSIPLDQIYSTDYHRTQQTASFTATDKNLMVESYDPSYLYNSDFQVLTKGQTVLVVGHSNTTPKFVNTILKRDAYPDMADDDNASLYKVIIRDDVADVLVMKVE